MWFVLNQKLDRYLDALSGRLMWTNVYGLARACIAAATLTNLAVNPIRPLIAAIQPAGNVRLPIQTLSLFDILGPEIGKAVSIVILLLVIIGWRPRLTGILHAWVGFSYINSIYLVDGGDQIAAIISLLLVPICLLDPRKWVWQPISDADRSRYRQEKWQQLTARSFLILIRLQVAIIYLEASMAKTSVPEWVDGTAVYYWFTDPAYGLIDPLRTWFMPVLTSGFWVSLMTWSVLIFELLLFSALFMHRRWHAPLLVAGVLFHFAIFVVHGLFTFFLVMTGALILHLRAPDRPFTWVFKKP